MSQTSSAFWVNPYCRTHESWQLWQAVLVDWPASIATALKRSAVIVRETASLEAGVIEVLSLSKDLVEAAKTRTTISAASAAIATISLTLRFMATSFQTATKYFSSFEVSSQG